MKYNSGESLQAMAEQLFIVSRITLYGHKNSYTEKLFTVQLILSSVIADSIISHDWPCITSKQGSGSQFPLMSGMCVQTSSYRVSSEESSDFLKKSGVLCFFKQNLKSLRGLLMFSMF